MAIVSFSRRFIFCKTRKTAGTSLEVFFSRHCAETDIVTTIIPPNPEHRPRNHDGFYNHMPIREIRDRLGGDVFNGMYRFCVERHPIDKCLSFFGMILNRPDFQDSGWPRTWGEYVDRGEFPIDVAAWTDEAGNPLVDRVYRYEELDDMLADLGNRFAMPKGPLDIWEKSGWRAGAPTRDEVTSAQRQRIMDAFAGSLRHVSYN